MGYARGSCPRFPAGDGPDAARFTISADSGEALRVYYVLERDHHPWSHGPLEFSGASVVGDGPVQLAQAYVASYRRRLAEASRR